MWIRNPTYIGFCMACAGASLAAGSPAGLWLVTPVVCLACAALVFGYERHDLARRFGEDALRPPPLLSLPRGDGDAPSPAQRVAVFLWVLIPWLIAYYAVKAAGIAPDAFETALPFERAATQTGVPVFASVMRPAAPAVAAPAASTALSIAYSVAARSLQKTQATSTTAAATAAVTTTVDTEHLAQKPVPKPVVVEAEAAPGHAQSTGTARTKTSAPRASGTAKAGAPAGAPAASGGGCPGPIGGGTGGAPGSLLRRRRDHRHDIVRSGILCLHVQLDPRGELPAPCRRATSASTDAWKPGWSGWPRTRAPTR